MAARTGPASPALIERLRDEQAEANEELGAVRASGRLAALEGAPAELVDGRPRRDRRGGGGVKARRVKKLDPREPARARTPRGSSASGSTSCARSPRGRSSRAAARPSTTCGSPPSACATCSRRPSSASVAAAETARRRARDLQDVLGELHDCDVMLPRVEGHLAELRDEDAEAVRGERRRCAPTSTRGSQPGHRTAPSYRGLEILIVYLQARRQLSLRSVPGLLGRAGAVRYLGSPRPGGRRRRLRRRKRAPAQRPSEPNRRDGSSRRRSAKGARGAHREPQRRRRS